MTITDPPSSADPDDTVAIKSKLPIKKLYCYMKSKFRNDSLILFKDSLQTKVYC